MREIELAFATPRKLPKAKDLKGRVVVLDIAFASDASSKSGFEKITLPFITAIGPRLAAWVDHHDSDRHVDYTGDPRFVLATKAQHGACPEMITPALVERIGPIDTIVCHTDFDGLASAAKWMRGGEEPYPGCDDDARAIDTRIGIPGPIAVRFDRAIRAHHRDPALFGVVVRHMASGLVDRALWQTIDDAGAEYAQLEDEARTLSAGYLVDSRQLAIVDVTGHRHRYDKTALLLMGQQKAQVAMVIDGDTITLACAFDSGVNLLELLGISGGMPTRVSIPKARLAEALQALKASAETVGQLVDASQ